jgi:hypothetical protein
MPPKGIPLPIWLGPVWLSNIAIDKGHIKKEGPTKCLPRAAAEGMIIGIIRPQLVTSINMIHFVVVSSSNSRDFYHLNNFVTKKALYRLGF